MSPFAAAADAILLNRTKNIYSRNATIFAELRAFFINLLSAKRIRAVTGMYQFPFTAINESMLSYLNRLKSPHLDICVQSTFQVISFKSDAEIFLHPRYLRSGRIFQIISNPVN